MGRRAVRTAPPVAYAVTTTERGARSGGLKTGADGRRGDELIGSGNLRSERRPDHDSDLWGKKAITSGTNLLVDVALTRGMQY